MIFGIWAMALQRCDCAGRNWAAVGQKRAVAEVSFRVAQAAHEGRTVGC